MWYYSDGKYSMRPVTNYDLDELIEHRNDESTWSNLTDVLPIYEHKQREWFSSLGEKKLYFIGEYTDRPTSFIRITDIDFVNSNACVGLDIFLGQRGHGHATPFMKMVVDYCFEILNLNRVWLLVLETNEAARKVYNNVGFVKEGRMRSHIFRDGRYHDYILMGLLRSEFLNGDG